jgi:hypothetical protein
LKNPVISGEMFYLSTAVPDVITFGQVHGYFAAGLFTSIDLQYSNCTQQPKFVAVFGTVYHWLYQFDEDPPF